MSKSVMSTNSMKKRTKGVGNRKTKMVPWFSMSEWEEVYAKIYSPSIADRQWAVDRITVWKSRSHPSLSLGIAATEALVRAQLQDTLHSIRQASCRTSDIELLYSMAIVRFMNLIAELGQCDQYETPLRNVVKKLNIPEWMVDLRHNATHAIMPSIEMLRKGAQFALQWLRVMYWEREENTMLDWIPPFTLETQYSEMQIIACLSHYMELQKKRHCQELPKEKRAEASITLKNTLTAISAMLEGNAIQFLDILVTPGFLIPNEPQFMTLSPEVKISKVWETIWKPVLSRIQASDNITDLLEALIRSEASSDDIYHQLGIAWAFRIISTVISSGCIIMHENHQLPKTINPKETMKNKKKKKKKILLSSPNVLYINWKRLLRAAVRSPSKNSPDLLTLIASQVGSLIPSAALQHLMALTAIYLGKTIETNVQPSSHKTSTIQTVQDIKKALMRDQDSMAAGDIANNISLESRSSWHLCKDPIDWTSYPLGTLPGFPVKSGIHELEFSSASKESDVSTDILKDTELYAEDAMEICGDERNMAAAEDMSDVTSIKDNVYMI